MKKIDIKTSNSKNETFIVHRLINLNMSGSKSIASKEIRDNKISHKIGNRTEDTLNKWLHKFTIISRDYFRSVVLSVAPNIPHYRIQPYQLENHHRFDR